MRPVVPGFYPDPSICRVGDTYWMVHSSFEYAPGVPLLRSTDLLSWEHVRNVLARPSQLDVSAATASFGISAATIRHHDGRFWMVTTNTSDGGMQVLVTAEDPLGEWSEPVRLPNLFGIDPDLAWDDDGSLLLTYAHFDITGETGGSGIAQLAIDPVSGEALTPHQLLWQGAGGAHPEGPHLYRIGDHWYQLMAEGGTERGHAVTIARGPSPAGPFEPCPWNPILTARSTDSPVQNVGHGDLVQRPDGSWAIVFHGVRARGVTPAFHVIGRETFAAEVEWIDGWPRIGEWLSPPAAGPVRVRELTGGDLPVTWMAVRRFPAELLTREDDGWRLTAVDPDPASEDLAFVGRRQAHLFARFRGTVSVPAGALGGVSLRMDPRSSVDLEVEGDRVRAVAQIGSVRAVLGQTPTPPGEQVVLEVRTVPAELPAGQFFSTALGPDVVVAGLVGADGEFQELGRLDGRYLSTEVSGGFNGRVAGVWCARGSLVVHSTEYAGSDDAQQLD